MKYFISLVNFLKGVFISFKYKIPFKGSKFFFEGLSYSILTDEYLIRIPRHKRVNNFIKEINQYGNLWCVEKNSIKRFEQEVKLFILLNKKKAFIKNNLLFIEKIDARPLSLFLGNEKFLFLLKKAIEKLIEYRKRYNFCFGDFHLNNMLVDKEYNIYFIDFEYTFSNDFKELCVYGNIIIFLNYMVLHYYDYFHYYYIDLLRLIKENHLKKELFLIVLNKMKLFLEKEGSYVEIKDFINELL
jgi:thiamine kinase-like enzyme